jgi:hypothetical protein
MSKKITFCVVLVFITVCCARSSRVYEGIYVGNQYSAKNNYTLESPAFCGYYACMGLLLYMDSSLDISQLNTDLIYKPYLNQIEILLFLNKNTRLTHKYHFSDPNIASGKNSPFIAFLPIKGGSNDYSHCVLVTDFGPESVLFYSKHRGPYKMKARNFVKLWEEEDYGCILSM